MSGNSVDKSLWIVVPAYNEGPVIEGVVQSLKKSFQYVLVVDDGSTDETFMRAQGAGACVLRHVINCGEGAALQTGIEFACQNGAQYIATFDADGQHKPEDLEKMLQVLVEGQCDIVLGSRFLSEKVQIPLARKLLLRMAVLWTRATVGILLTDAHNGLRVMSFDVAKKLNIQQNRMAHASEIIETIHAEQIKFKEFPVEILYTEYSMQKGQKWWNLFDILKELFVGRLMK